MSHANARCVARPDPVRRTVFRVLHHRLRQFLHHHPHTAHLPTSARGHWEKRLTHCPFVVDDAWNLDVHRGVDAGRRQRERILHNHNCANQVVSNQTATPVAGRLAGSSIASSAGFMIVL
jgi:hypothetical protein